VLAIFAIQPGLVIALLSDPPDGAAKIDALIRHVAERLWALLRVSEEDAQAYNAHANLSPGMASRRAWPAGIASRSEDEQYATGLVEQFLCWHTEPCPDEQAFWRNFVVRLLDQRPVAVAAAEQVPITIKSGTIAALLTGEKGGLTYFRIGALDPKLADRETIGWAAVLLCFEHFPVIATALGDATGVLALQTRPQEAINNAAVRSRLVNGLVTPPAMSDLKTQTEEAHRLLRAEVTRCFGESGAVRHARRQARLIARVFIDMMSKDWSYGWDCNLETPDFGRGRPSAIFDNGGVWPLFAPNSAMLNTYVRAAAGARLKPAQCGILRPLQRALRSASEGHRAARPDLCRHCLRGRKSRTPHPPSGAARFRVAAHHHRDYRRHRSGRDHGDDAHGRALPFLGRAGTQDKRARTGPSAPRCMFAGERD
jgi:hypothetical protein